MAPLVAAVTGFVVAIVAALALGHLLGTTGIAAGIACGAWSNALSLVRRGSSTFGFALDAAARRRVPRIVAAATAMGGLLWLVAGVIPPSAHGVAQAASLAVLVGGSIALYALLLTRFGVTGWRDAVHALRQTPPRDLRARS